MRNAAESAADDARVVVLLGGWEKVRVDGTRDERIAAIAARQRGRVARRQLIQAGLSYDQIRRQVAAKRLIPRHPGVFAAGHLAPATLAVETEALLAVTPPVLISHRSATVVWGLARADDSEPIHLLVPHGSAPRLDCVCVHRTTTLHRRDQRMHHGLPITSPARALLDFAEAASDGELARAYEEAWVRKLIGPGAVDEITKRLASRPGAPRLRRLRHGDRRPGLTRSEAERRMRELIRAAGLPEPLVNVPLHGFEIDFYWPRERLALEVDGFAFHSTRRAFDRDHRKDATLRAHGIFPMRISRTQIADEPYSVVAQTAQALVWATRQTG